MFESFPEAWEDALRSSGNRLAYAFRNTLSYPGPPYREPRESKAGLFGDEPDAARAAAVLSARYDLSRPQATASRLRYQECLAYLEWLDTARQTRPDWFRNLFETAAAPLRALDVGAKNWAYVDAPVVFLKAHCPVDFRLDGIELDPHRRYADFRTRRQAALAHSRDLPEAHYHMGNILDWPQPAQFITHFLPFVAKDPLLDWGLSLKHYQPEALLRHVLSLLSPGGLMFIVNQGEAEAELQTELLATVGKRVTFRCENLGQLPARFIQYRYPRYGWLILKDPA